MGIVIDNKDYLSTIILSLPFSLSSFASAQLAAARMFASTKTIKPDVLMSLLMEEADQQRAQQVRCASKKGTDEDKWEALASEGSSKPRKGKGKENIRCWNCEEMGHYSHECKKLRKSNEKAKDEAKAPQGTSASAVKPVWNVKVHGLPRWSRMASQRHQGQFRRFLKIWIGWRRQLP